MQRPMVRPRAADRRKESVFRIWGASGEGVWGPARETWNVNREASIVLEAPKRQTSLARPLRTGPAFFPFSGLRLFFSASPRPCVRKPFICSREVVSLRQSDQ